MAGRITTPLGGNDHQMVVDRGTMIRHASPVPGGLRGPCERPQEISVQTLVFSGERLHRFFRSVAHSIVLARHIKLKPMRADPEKDPLGVRVIMKIMPDSSLPEEVDLPSPDEIEAEMKPEANRFGELFWEELDERGVQGVLAFLEDLEAQRENALAKVQNTYREASKHNTGAIETATTIVRTLTVVKFTATIVVAGLTLPVATAYLTGAGVAASSSLATFGVGTGYSVSLKLIKAWDKASNAELVAVATEKAATKTEQKVAKDIGKTLKGAYEGEVQDLASAERKVEWLEKRVADAGRARDVRRLAQAKDAVRAAKTAGVLAKGLSAVPYLFFAWSVKDAIQTAREDWQ
jgi:hypothetical protein